MYDHIPITNNSKYHRIIIDYQRNEIELIYWKNFSLEHFTFNFTVPPPNPNNLHQLISKLNNMKAFI